MMIYDTVYAFVTRGTRLKVASSGAEARMVFRGGYAAKYKSPIIACAVWVGTASPVFIIVVHLGS